MSNGPYGITLDVGLDFHPTFRAIRSLVPGDAAARQILVNALVRGLETPRGSQPDAPEWGYDSARLLLAALGPNQLDEEVRQIEAQCERDERVTSASVTVIQRVTSTGGIEADVTISIVPDFDGPFEFTMTVSQAATEIRIEQ